MPDNLTIQISADTGKARADLELLKGRLQELGKEMRAARAEAMKTGDRTNLDRLAREYETVTRSAKGLQTQLRATNREVASPAWAAAAKGAAALNTELVGLARGLAAGGGLGAALLATVNLIGRTASELLELRRLSQSTGFSPGAIKAFNEALEDTGQEAGAGNRGLVRLSQGFAEVRQAARNAGETIGSAMRIMRGGEGRKDKPNTFGIDVSRGGQREVVAIKNVADALEVLGVDMRKFKDDAAGNDAALQAIINGFADLEKKGKIDLGNLAAQQLWGKNMRETVPAMKALAQEAGGLQAKMDELRAQNRFPTDEDMKRAAEYNKALRDIGDAYDAVGFSFLKAFGPEAKNQMALFAGEVEALGQAFRDVKDIVTGNWNWPAGPPAWLMRFLGAGPDTLPPADQPTEPRIFPIENRASGGMIRGPGSGTSDSILARLSNGEFVMRAAAVNKWGPQFMAALNSMRNPFGYAGGGLVRRFATGGMVTARTADGTTVNLHFPSGSSFALRGDAGIVAGLVREGRRAGMLNAGRLPGAFAA